MAGTKRAATSNISSSDMSMDEDTVELPPPRKPKPPPITVHSVTNFQEFVKLLLKGSPIDSPTSTKTIPNGNVKVFTQTDEEYRRVISLLREANFEYHHFQLKSEKPFRIVVRGLNPDTSFQDITDDLHQKGHKVRNLSNITYKKKNEGIVEIIKLPLFFIDLEPQPNNKESIELKYIAYQSIQVEPPKPKTDIPLCKRCQKFGHTRNYCSLPPKCVKCGESHLTYDCNKDPTTPATCANCAGDHPANWRGCSHYKQLQQTSNRQHNLTSFAVDRLKTVRPEISYSKAASSSTSSVLPSSPTDISTSISQITFLLEKLVKRVETLESRDNDYHVVASQRKKPRNDS